MNIKKFAFLLCLLITVPAFAADHYCDLTLSSNGTGTIGDPWQWSQAIDSGNVSPSDVVHLRDTGGSVTIDTDTDANGTAGNQITYQQWSGETQAQFTSIIFDGANSPYYKFDGIIFDAGTGTTWITAISETLSSSSGKVTFNDCTINGFRSSLYTGGDYFPYYLGDIEAHYVNRYSMTFTGIAGINLEITNCTFTHGWRLLSLSDVTGGSVLIEGNTFDRCGEDFISVGLSESVTIRNNTFASTSPASRNYAVWFWPRTGTGTATGTWSGHEGETITQDTSDASAIFVGLHSGRLYVVVDDSEARPSRDTTYIWRLDSDPANVYWDPGYAGDNSHNDHIQVQGDADDVLIEKNYFDGTTGAIGYAIKFNHTGIENAIFRNNIINYNAPSPVYCILAENSGSTNIVNNYIVNKESDSLGIRTISGGFVIANNIIGGGTNSGGIITATNNIFPATDPWSGANSLINQDFSDSPSGNDRYFADYANGDYTTYNVNSPQVNTGSAVYAPGADYLGTPRPQGAGDDIGAYEYIIKVSTASGTGSRF